MVLPMAVIILLAVGADYNLLVCPASRRTARGPEHRHDPGDGGSGSTVTAPAWCSPSP
jgi:hypothetical protein